MAITKKIQFLRNNTIYTGADGAAARNAAIAGMRGIATGSTTSGDIVDGQAILARYNAAGSASTGNVQTVYGIVHKGVNGKTGVTIYESSELLWAAINEYVSTSTTISAGTGLSGGGQLSAEAVTLRHDTTTRQDTMPQDPTDISNGGSFTAVTSVGSNTLGHVTGVTRTVFNLPNISDTAVTQEQLTASTSHPIILKVDNSTSASASNKVYYSSGATVDKTGNIKTTGNVSAATVSANNVTAATAVRAGNMSAGTISAGTSIYSPSVSGATISGGSLTASGNVRGGNVSADTISAATHVKSPTISGGSVTASGNIRGGNVSADTISAATHVKAPTISGTSALGVTVSATSAYGATISGGTYKGLPVASSTGEGIVKVVETTGTATGSTVMSQSAVTEAISAALVDVADALVYKGTVSGQSTSPGASLPKADKGDVYKVAVSGYVAGQKVEVGDMFICNTDNTASGTASTNWDVIQTNVDMANYVQSGRTITAASPLSGGGNLGSDVTIGHKTITTSAVMPQGDPTQISDGGEFTAVTSIDTDGYGHPKFVRSTAFKLPTDSKVTQEQFTGSTSNPIIIKVDSGTSASARNKVYFSSAATIDKTGNIKAASVSATNISAATNVRAGNVSAGTITATTDMRAGNMSAATISAATSVKSPTISGTNITASNLVTASGFSATAAVSTASTDIDASILLSNGKNTNTIDCGTY